MFTTILTTVAISLALTVPLAWKWQLGLLRCTVAVAALAVASATGVHALVGTAWGPGLAVPTATVVALAATTLLLAYRFFRDPDRQSPDQPDAIVSPAEGTVLYVRETAAGALPVSTKHGRSYRLDELTGTELRGGESVVIGISMSFLDVHVNRAPIGGRVRAHRHIRGTFSSLRDPEAIFSNERATTVVEGDGLEVAVVQIASRLVRAIVSYVQPGDLVVPGQRTGVIRFGSQVDLVLPRRSDLEVLVAPGDHVRAGSSALATCPAVSGSREQRVPPAAE